MAALNFPFAASATRRAPTSGELADGYGCGDADLELFDYLAWWFSGQIAHAITEGGLTVDDADLSRLALAIQSGKSTYAVATGTANAWTVAPSLAVPAYAAGRVLNIIAPATNTSTTVNANISTLGNRRIKKADGTDPAVGDLVGGKVYQTIDDGTNIRVLNTLASDVGVFRSITNIQQFTSTTRSAIVGNSGNSYEQTAWSPGSYNKISATSNLMVWLAAPSYVSGPTGPASLKLSVAASTIEIISTNNFPGQNNGENTITGKIVSGLSAGSKSLTVSMRRNDTTDWAAIWLPSSSDNSYFNATSTANLVIGEIEP